jgi:hypothetical protein
MVEIPERKPTEATEGKKLPEEKPKDATGGGKKLPKEEPKDVNLEAEAKSEENPAGKVDIEERKSEQEEAAMSEEEAFPPEAPPAIAPEPEVPVEEPVDMESRMGNVEAAMKSLGEQMARVQEILDEVLGEGEEVPEVAPEVAVPPVEEKVAMSMKDMTALFTKMDERFSTMENQLGEMNAQFSKGSKKSIASGAKKRELSEGELWALEYQGRI